MFDSFKIFLINKVPIIKNLYRKKRQLQKRRAFKGLSLEQVFTKIYKERLWYFGDKSLPQPFYSGTGSYGSPAEAYIGFVSNFINEHKISSIVDIGCGDFAIGKQIVSAAPENLSYTGCDIVKELVDYNNNNFAINDSRIRFLHVNACVDLLPSGELLTIRQVFQHLSNEQILQILGKTSSFKYVLITEHQPGEGLQQSFNADKRAGPDIRLAHGSGIYLDRPPFNLNATEVLRCREDANGKEAFIVTYLLNGE